MTSDVLVRRTGRVGRVTLNRPRAINALTLAMIRSITEALRDWAEDPAVEAVVLDGAGERGFCAGGDIRAVYDSARARDGHAEVLWREEYQLDLLVARFPKPVVSILDGIAMGGGVGLGCHRPIRIVTERSTLAMPEVRIGFAPDVGGTLLYARAPGRIGEHLALTASSVGPDDAVYCGLADHVVPSDRLGALLERLASEEISDVIADFAVAPGEPRLAGDRDWIDECYSADTVPEIIERLGKHEEPRAAEAARQIRGMAPLGLTVTLEAIRRTNPDDDLEDVLRRDLRIMTRFLDTPDLVEGIRAAVVDKDRNPAWSPASFDEVTPQAVARHFAPLDRELECHLPSWSR